MRHDDGLDQNETDGTDEKAPPRFNAAGGINIVVDLGRHHAVLPFFLCLALPGLSHSFNVNRSRFRR